MPSRGWDGEQGYVDDRLIDKEQAIYVQKYYHDQAEKLKQQQHEQNRRTSGAAAEEEQGNNKQEERQGGSPPAAVEPVVVDEPRVEEPEEAHNDEKGDGNPDEEMDETVLEQTPDAHDDPSADTDDEEEEESAAAPEAGEDNVGEGGAATTPSTPSELSAVDQPSAAAEEEEEDEEEGGGCSSKKKPSAEDRSFVDEAVLFKDEELVWSRREAEEHTWTHGKTATAGGAYGHRLSACTTSSAIHDAVLELNVLGNVLGNGDGVDEMDAHEVEHIVRTQLDACEKADKAVATLKSTQLHRSLVTAFQCGRLTIAVAKTLQRIIIGQAEGSSFWSPSRAPSGDCAIEQQKVRGGMR